MSVEATSRFHQFCVSKITWGAGGPIRAVSRLINFNQTAFKNIIMIYCLQCRFYIYKWHSCVLQNFSKFEAGLLKSISYGLPPLGLFGLGWTPEASRRRIRQALRQTRDIFKFCLEGRLGEKITQLWDKTSQSKVNCRSRHPLHPLHHHYDNYHGKMTLLRWERRFTRRRSLLSPVNLSTCQPCELFRGNFHQRFYIGKHFPVNLPFVWTFCW